MGEYKLKKLGFWSRTYLIWAIVSIPLAIIWAGLTPESITRLLVISLLAIEIRFRERLGQLFPQLLPRTRFLVLAIFLAAIVEGFHMISRPVFLSLRLSQDTPFWQGIRQYLIDLAFTIPAYLVIFAVIWYFINRFYFSGWQYILTMGLAQTLGDGGLFFFLQAPLMLFFLPYPMSNYHAVNILPFLAVYDHLKQERKKSFLAYLSIPVIIIIYFLSGTVIKIVGRYFGLED